MASSGKVVTGRKWTNPEIYAEISSDGVRMEISLEDFLLALSAEMGSPLFLLTADALRKRIEEASARVMSEVRTASKEVV